MTKPDPTWVRSLGHRLDNVDRRDGGMPVSIKVRVTSGCFCRSCCRHAWKIIDDHYPRFGSTEREEYRFEEHESGPEIILYIAAATASITLAKSVIDLVTTIVKARSEGRKKGDSRSEPLEIIVRRVHRQDELREELVVRVDQESQLKKKDLEAKLKSALEKLRDSHSKSE